MLFGSRGREIAVLRADNERLGVELDEARVIGSIALVVEGELDDLSQRGIIENEARAIVTDRVVEQERDRLVREETRRIEAEESNAIAETFRREQGPTITAGIRSDMTRDGRLAEIRVDAEERVRDEMETEVTKEVRREVDESLATPEEQARIRRELKDSISGSDETAAYREDVVRDIQAELNPEVTEELQAEIRDELSSDEERARIKAELRESLVDTDRIIEFREDETLRVRRECEEEVEEDLRREITASVLADEPRVRRRIRSDLLASDRIAEFREGQTRDQETRVAEMTLEEVQSEVRDQELTRVLQKRADREKEVLRREERAAELEEQFTRGDGIDLTLIDSGTVVDIYLGNDIGSFTFDVPNSNNRGTTQQDKPTAFFVRKISLASVGQGRFVVNRDSLKASESAYESSLAFTEGERVFIGRQKVDEGDVSLEPALFADVPLFYDTDTSDTKIENALYPVLDVVIDGISARNVEHIEATKQPRA